MIKRLTIALGIALAACGVAQAQVQNYALSLEPGSSVDCGAMPQLNGLESYTLQFWFNPAEWNQGAVLFQRGNEFKVALGAPSELVFTLGSATVTAKSDQMAAGKWAQITLRGKNTSASVLVNGTNCGRSTNASLPESDANFIIGGSGYKGRIDEVRIWKTLLSNEFENYMYTTLTPYVPEYSDLLVYYKMDQDECEHLVDYCAIDKELDYNNHGILKGGATKVAVTDNAKMPYLLNSAYTANERFYDRYIPAEQYLMANDLINLGILTASDGHLQYATTCDHGTLKGDATRLEEFEGRKTVMSVNGNGYMEIPESAISNKEGYGINTYIYLEEWTDGGYLLRRENADGTEGMAIYLDHFQSDRVPESTPVIVVRVNGNHWRFPVADKLPVGEWKHLGVSYLGGGTLSTMFNIGIDGKTIGSVRTFYHDGSTEGIPNWDNIPTAQIGQGLKAKFDRTEIPKSSVSLEHFTANMRGMKMPGIGISVESQSMQRVGAYYDYDDPENPGYDLYSQDHWLKIMKSAYEGYRGAKFYISVKTPSGNLSSLLAKQSFRENFATDLAKLSEPYDGVELDLEWVYDWYWYGEMAKLIREKLPEGKIFRVSTHNVSYSFPKNRMQYVDGFTFQQYGPQKTHFFFSHFKNMCNAFVNYGYPKDKIMTSYSTTTSESDQGAPIKGVKDGFFDDGYVPALESESKKFVNDTYWFTGPLQTYERAKFTRENNMMGIFYWDMGNDVYEPADANGHRAMHKYNLARWSTYAIAPNVDRYITKVDVAHYGESGLMDVVAETETALSVVLDGTTLHVCVPGKALETATLCNTAGSEVFRTTLANGTADLSGLNAGIYILSVKAADGTTYSTKFINK